MESPLDITTAHILIAEHSLADIALIKAFFAHEKISNHITYVRSLAQARTALAHNMFHLCFVDIQLPDGDGFDLVEDMNTRNTAVVILSNSKDMDYVLHAKSLGAVAYISKPLNKAKMDRLIQELRHLHWQIAIRPTMSHQPPA